MCFWWHLSVTANRFVTNSNLVTVGGNLIHSVFIAVNCTVKWLFKDNTGIGDNGC